MSTVKKSVSIILSLLILISVFAVAPITANAEVSNSGTVGDCQYEFNSSTGHLRIFGGTTIEKDGNGKMPWATDGPLTFNSLSVKSVTIEDGIKTIGNGAFYWCKNLTSVTMPLNLTYIGKSAFSDCTGLKTIRLPFYLQTIDMAAFSNCTALESISISTHIELIGSEAFKGCTKLAEVTINDGAKAEIGSYAFCDTALTDVFIPAGTTKIDTCAFGYDKSYSPIAAFTIYTTEGSGGDTYVKNNDHITVEYIKPITNVDFTDIVEPVVGESPSFTYNTTSEGFTVKNSKPVWNNETDGTTVSATKTFKNLKVYRVEFTLKANKGYRFAVNDKRKTTVKGTINGQDAIITGDSTTPEDEITVTLTFPKLIDPDDPVLIYDVNIRLDEQPKAGDQCDSKLRTYGEGYSVDSFYWYNVTDAKREYSGNVFEPLKEYKLNVILKADEYYAFCYADNAIQVGGEIDGKAINTYEAYKKDPREYIHVESTSYIMGEQDISTVAFTKINEPIVDRPAIFTYQASRGVTLEDNKIEWWNDTDKEDMKNGDMFEKGKTYIAFFNMTAKDGYNFTVDKDDYTTVTATVNHKEAIVQQLSGQNPVKKLRVYVKYFNIQEKTPLTSVDITDLDKPVAGEKPDYNVSVSSNATVTDIIWREEGRKMQSGDVYQYSRQYTVYIYIEPDSGYTFKGDSRNVEINGSKAQVSFDSYEDYIIAIATYVTEADPEATYETSEPTESSPEETTEPDTGKTTDPEETTEPKETTEPEETTEPLETTEPKETSETEETTSVITEPDVITISYLPSDEQELNGYNYRLFFKDKDGNDESMQMIPTGDKANGKDIYGAVLPADKEYIEMYIQILYGEEWVKQIEINPNVAKNAIIGSDGNPITVEPDTDPESPSDPVIHTDPDTPTTPSGKYQTLSYMPDKNILDKSDKIVIVVQDAEGNVETTEMTKTSETSGGVPIYTAQIPADKELYMATFKYYKGETFVGQLNVSGTQLKAAEGKIIDSFGNIVTPDTPKVTAKKANPIKVTAKTKSVKLKKLKKKAQKVKVLTIKNAQGKVSVKITKAKKSIKKFLKINTKGKLTIKKWKKAKKGTYKIKVQIKAKGNTNYKSKTINKTVKVKVK